jgi:hypothetical protein
MQDTTETTTAARAAPRYEAAVRAVYDSLTYKDDKWANDRKRYDAKHGDGAAARDARLIADGMDYMVTAKVGVAHDTDGTPSTPIEEVLDRVRKAEAGNDTDVMAFIDGAAPHANALDRQKMHDKIVEQNILKAYKDTQGAGATTIHAETAGDFIRRAAGGVKWLVDGLIPYKGVSLAVGPPRSLKTLSVLRLAYAACNGRAWLGRSVVEGPVLYIAEEGAVGFMGEQLATLQAMYGQKHDLHIVHMQGVRPQNAQNMAQIEAIVAEHRPVLTIIDTYARTVQGNENDADTAASYLNALTPLTANYDTTFIVIHHPSKAATGSTGNHIRGSGALYGGVDATLVFHRDTGPMDTPMNSGRIAVESKYAEYQVINFEIEFDGDIRSTEGSRLTMENLIDTITTQYATTHKPVPRTYLQEVFHASESSILNHLKDAVAEGRLTKTGAGRKTAYMTNQGAGFGLGTATGAGPDEDEEPNLILVSRFTGEDSEDVA